MSHYGHLRTGFAACVIAASGTVSATTYYVPDDYLTIQAAIDDVIDGDVVIVRAGSYNETIDFKNKAIRVESEGGPDVTTITATGLATTTVLFVGGEGPDSILEGFTITGGEGTLVEDLEITMGGGILIVQGSPKVIGCKIDGNTAQSGGGLAVYLEGHPVIEACTFESNEATLATGFPDLGGGGGILVHEAAVTVTDCVLKTNDADYGGAMTARRSSTLVQGTAFESNTSAANGAGGLFTYYGETELRASVFRTNSSTGHVGGFFDHYGERVTVTGCDFIGNTGLSSGGALLWYTTGGTFLDCLFQENSAAVYAGGGLGLGYTTAVMDRCRFYDNTAQSLGGGLAMTYEANTIVTSCEFVRNHAARGGGLGSSSAGYLSVTACSFIENTAAAGGGGINHQCCDSFRMTGCLLARNTASNGGGIYNFGGVPKIVATTIMDNSATNSGGGIFNGGTTLLFLTGSVLWNNSSDQIYNAGGSTSNVTYSDVQGGHIGAGNLDVDPLCADPANGDYSLLSESLCIDAGANNALPADEYDLDEDGDTKERFPIDIDGNPRFADVDTKEDTGCGLPVIVDMGAYEYQGDPVHPMLIGDIDGNGLVEFPDILDVLAEWGPCSDDCCLADVNYDGYVIFNDLLAILANWS